MRKAKGSTSNDANLLIGDSPEDTVARCADLLEFLIDAEHAIGPGDAVSPSSANGKCWMMISAESALRHAVQRLDEERKSSADR